MGVVDNELEKVVYKKLIDVRDREDLMYGSIVLMVTANFQAGDCKCLKISENIEYSSSINHHPQKG